MSRDRASVVATALLAALARRLRGSDVHAEIAELLREEFRDAQQTALRETRLDDPPD